MKLSEFVQKFLNYCEIEKNQSRRTIRNYSHYLRRFAEFSGDIDLANIDLELVQQYRLHLNRYEDERGRTLSRKTQNYHVIALRAFLKFLIKRDYNVLSPEKIDLAKKYKLGGVALWALGYEDAATLAPLAAYKRSFFLLR